MKKTGVFIIVMVACAALSAQEPVEIKKKEFRSSTQTEGFKEAWKSIKEGDKYYEQGKGTFNLARDLYLFANQYNGYNAELNYKIGICYLFSDEKLKAIDYLLKAFELKPDVSPEILFLIGRAYHLVLEFDKAKSYYLKYRSTLPPDEEFVEMNDQIDKLVAECTHGKALTREPHRVIIQNLGENINSQYDDYNPRFSYNDTALFYTSRRPLGKRPDRIEIDNKFNEGVFVSSIQGGGFQEAYPMGKPFISKGNISLVGVDPAGKSLFIYRGDVEGGDIQQSDFNFKKSRWTKPKSLAKYIGTNAEETVVALAPGGSELYFISSNPEQTNGGKDIFVSRLDHKGRWGEPENLGALINSRYDEEGVYISADGNTMYFSSKGHNSMGGFDVFKSRKSETGRWATPKNLGYPINTPDDEVFYVTDSTGVYGFYSAFRDGGYGGRDIYKVITLGSEKEVSTLTKDKLVAGFDYIDPNPFLSFPVKLEIDTSLMLAGQVRDTVGVDTLIMAGLSFMDPSTGEVVARAMTGTDGYYRAQLPQAKVYGIEINATGYLYYLDIIDLSSLNPDEPAEQDFFLQKIEVGTKVILENIYFETGKSVLTAASYGALDQVVRFLENNPSVRLEISGHTDNTGSLRINTNLSQARAKSVVDYLSSNGIDKARLEYKGYADTQAVADNSTPEGREMNRRVEFKVLSK